MNKTKHILLLAVILALASAGFQLGAQTPDKNKSRKMVSGTVVDAADQPVAGATVEYWQYDLFNWARLSSEMGPERVNQVTTGTDGTFEFQVAEDSGLLLARKAGLAPAWLSRNSAFSPAAGTGQKMVLTSPGTLAGQVLDESNRPVAGVEVRVRNAFVELALGNGGQTYQYLDGKTAQDLFSTRTDAAGHFHIGNFPTNATAVLSVKARGKALRPPDSGNSNLAMAGYRTGEDIKLMLEPAGGIEGKIVCAETNQPPSIAMLMLVAHQPGMGNEPVKSDASGAFRFNDVAAGDYRIQVNFGTNGQSEWVAEAVTVSVEAGQVARGLQVTATRGALLEVSVVGERDHQAMAQVNVTAFLNNNQANAVTDEHGIARLHLLPGDYQINANRPPRSWAQSPATVEAGVTNRIEIEMPAPKKIAGIVRTPDGQPAAGMSVRLVGGNGMNMEGLQTDAAGKFEQEWNPNRFPGQDSESVCVLIRDPKKNLAVARDISEDDEDAGGLDLKLAPALTLFGRAEADGKPVPNATAALVFWSGNRGMWLQDLARTNTAGQYEISALPPGRKYGVIVSAPGYGQKQMDNIDVSAEPGRQELDTAELRIANLKLAGQVLDENDKPVAGSFVNLNGEDQPQGHSRTDHEGRFSFEHVCAGTVQLNANGQGSFGSISAEGGDTNVVLRLGQHYSSSPGEQTHKLTGLVTDPEGKPDPGAQLAVFPNFSGTHWTKAGEDGTYKLAWSLQPWQLQNGGGAHVVVRDLGRNLAGTEEVPEEATNLDLKLMPAVTLTGQVKNAAGAALPGAQIGMWFKAGNNYSTLDEQMKPADAEGRFEIKCLPAEGSYMVYASAKGYGKHQQQVLPDTETNRTELSPLVLKPADQMIAGQVLKEDDKPAAGVNVNLNGEDQPDGNMTTDKQGRFHFQVCEGRIQLFAYSQYGGGGNAQAAVQAGDTNIIMTLGAQMGLPRQARPHAVLKGHPLPDVTTVNLDAAAAPAGKFLLLCLFDASQRPSRHVIHLLDQQAAALGQKNVAVLGVQAAVVTDEIFNQWKTGSPVTFAVGRITEKSEKSRWAAEATALPWLVLTDASHQVVAEGFSLDELDAQIQKLAK